MKIQDIQCVKNLISFTQQILNFHQNMMNLQISHRIYRKFIIKNQLD